MVLGKVQHDFRSFLQKWVLFCCELFGTPSGPGAPPLRVGLNTGASVWAEPSAFRCPHPVSTENRESRDKRSFLPGSRPLGHRSTSRGGWLSGSAQIPLGRGCGGGNLGCVLGRSLMGSLTPHCSGWHRLVGTSILEHGHPGGGGWAQKACVCLSSVRWEIGDEGAGLCLASTSRSDGRTVSGGR